MATRGARTGLVARHGAHRPRLGHGVEQQGGVILGRTGLGACGHEGASRAAGEGFPYAAAQHLGREALTDGDLAHFVHARLRQQAAGGGEHRLVAGDALDGGALRLCADGVQVGRCSAGQVGIGADCHPEIHHGIEGEDQPSTSGQRLAGLVGGERF